ncbi:MAG TPA: hypothetical protein PL182_13225 [Pseudobdellovibrionaceae bacterium]|nr:hypothetical protein [Pseudobdellovibrionaceae bacterium]
MGSSLGPVWKKFYSEPNVQSEVIGEIVRDRVLIGGKEICRLPDDDYMRSPACLDGTPFYLIPKGEGHYYKSARVALKGFNESWAHFEFKGRLYYTPFESIYFHPSAEREQERLVKKTEAFLKDSSALAFFSVATECLNRTGEEMRKCMKSFFPRDFLYHDKGNLCRSKSGSVLDADQFLACLGDQAVLKNAFKGCLAQRSYPGLKPILGFTGGTLNFEKFECHFSVLGDGRWIFDQFRVNHEK